MKLDLTGIPLIDHHAHPFPAGRSARVAYEQNFVQSLNWVTPEHARSTMVFQMLNRQLRKLYGLSVDCSLEEMLEVRSQKIQSDRIGYISMLWKDAGYEGMIADVGSPVTKKLLTEAELKEFDEEMEGHFLRKVNRLEWVAEDVIESGVHSFEEFTEQYKAGLYALVQRQDLVGLKSIIAYKTGLDIKVLSADEFRKQYYLYLADSANPVYEKAFRDYCFCKGCEVAAELGLPLQIHTGLGDSPLLNLRNSNPLMLYEVINAYPETTFVLLHAGYPYCEEFGFLLSHYNNVYGDMSAMIPFASVAGESKLSALMEMAPMTKLMFGTDSGSIPEKSWYGAVLFRNYLTRTLQHFIDRGYISHGFALEMAGNMMYKNLKGLYKCD